MRGGAQITVIAQYFKAATSSQILLMIGSRAARNVSVFYSDSDATSFVATVTPSDAPGLVQASVSHSLDRLVVPFSLRYTGRQSAMCLRNCVSSALQGTRLPLLVNLGFFDMVTRSNQLRCLVSSFSSCSVELVNSSSTTMFVNISIGAVSSSIGFQNGVLPSVVTVYANDDSASFMVNIFKNPSVLSSNFITETSFELVFDQNVMFHGATDSSCDCFQNSLSSFGQDPICRVSRNTLTVIGGPSFSLVPGASVTLVPGVVFGSAQVANSLVLPVDSASGTFAILAPLRPQPPSLLFIAPSSVGPCDDLELRVDNPTPRALYSWICLNDDSVTAAAKARSVDVRSVKLRSTDLPRVNFAYTFVLSATSIFFQSSNSSVFQVFKFSQAVPNIISSRQSSLITIPIIVTAQVEFSACPMNPSSMVLCGLLQQKSLMSF
jgi:hypothetical protein